MHSASHQSQKRQQRDVVVNFYHRSDDCSCAFFFQAEDGIRGKLVTGVQTCALPISLWSGVGVLGVLRLVSSGEPAVDVVLAVAVGLVVGSTALVVIGTPGTEPDPGELRAIDRKSVV